MGEGHDLGARSASQHAAAGDASVLGDVLTRLDPHLPTVVDAFYLRLVEDPAAKTLVEGLTPIELGRLKRRQAEHVRHLLSPTSTLPGRTERSREIGRVHAMVGVEMDRYADAVADHRRGLVETLADHADGLDLASANAAVTDRFMQDLHGALLGYRDVDNSQHRAVLRVIRAVSDSRTVADLARGPGRRPEPASTAWWARCSRGPTRTAASSSRSAPARVRRVPRRRH